MARYCSVTEVRRYLPIAVVIEGENPNPNPRNPQAESLETSDIEAFIDDACGYIDSELGSIYSVPLRMTNMDGNVVYPPPIPTIAARYAAKLIFEQRLSGADQQSGEFVKKHYEEALRDLNGVVTGSRRLIGQFGQIGVRFARAAWYGIPPMPAKETPDKP